MLRQLAFAAALACLGGRVLAEPARVPVRIYLISPADQADPVTVLTATKPVAHEVKHVASTWGGGLFDYVNAGPDCQATDVTVTLAQPPAHGKLIVNQVTVPVFPRLKAALPKGDPRAACATLPIQQGFYRPDYDYLGRDHMAVSFQEGDASFTDVIEVDVRRAQHPNPLRPHH